MGFGIYEIIVLLILASFVFWAIALFDVLRSTFSGNNKLIWFLAVAFIPFIGFIAYFVVGRGQKISN